VHAKTQCRTPWIYCRKLWIPLELRGAASAVQNSNPWFTIVVNLIKLIRIKHLQTRVQPDAAPEQEDLPLELSVTFSEYKYINMVLNLRQFVGRGIACPKSEANNSVWLFFATFKNFSKMSCCSQVGGNKTTVTSVGCRVFLHSYTTPIHFCSGFKI